MITEKFKNQFLHSTQFDEEEDVLILDDIETGEPAELVVFNDDHNTFDWVIQSFVEILKHSAEQAEQCSMIVHFKGKAIVKTAPEKTLRPLREGLVDRGLSAVIERRD